MATKSTGVAIIEHTPGRYRAVLSYWVDSFDRVYADKPPAGARNVTRKRLQLYGTSQSEVRQKVSQATDRLRDQRPPRDDVVTFASYSHQWIEDSLDLSERRENTKDTYKHLIGKLNATNFANLKLGQIEKRDIQKALRNLEEQGYSESTRRQTYNVLKAIFRDAVESGVVAFDPTSGMKPPRVTQQDVHFFTVDELKSLLEKAQEHRLGFAMELIARTGIRKGEALGLRWKDVDFKQKQIRIRETLTRRGRELVTGPTKTLKSRRTIPISDRLVKVLEEWRVLQQAEKALAGSQYVSSDFVVTSQLGGPMDPRNFLRTFEILAKRAELEGNVHTLRHTAASIMLLNGIPMITVRDILGHSSIETTVDLYGHLTETDKARGTDLLGAAF